MKKGFLKKTLLLGLSAFLLGSCNLFTPSSFAPSSFETSIDEDGNTVITIYFEDDLADPFEITLPQGNKGVDASMIDKVDIKSNEDGSYTLTITFNDPSIPEIKLTLLYLEGINIVGIEFGYDETGTMVFQLVYSNGDKTDPISVPNGVIIESIEITKLDESVLETIRLTSGEELSFSLTNGDSILDIYLDPLKQSFSTYCITVRYSDGSEEDLLLDRPHSTQWFYGTIAPSEDYPLNALDGDFYYNYLTGWVYLNLEGNWIALLNTKADTSSSIEYATFTFDLNGGHIEEQTENFSLTYEKGKMVPLSNIPLPSKDGSIFLGWFTDLEDINAGKFSDLTIVLEDLDLIARWG